MIRTLWLRRGQRCRLITAARWLGSYEGLWVNDLTYLTLFVYEELSCILAKRILSFKIVPNTSISMARFELWELHLHHCNSLSVHRDMTLAQSKWRVK